MRIAIDSGPLSSGHAVRGVGAYTRELMNALKNQKEIEIVDKNYDIFHYPYFDLFFHSLVIQANVKNVVTVHDVIPLLYPEHYPTGIKGKINFWLQKEALQMVNAVITDSETSKKDVVRFLGIRPEKVHVVYLAPRKIFKKISDKKLLNLIQKKYDLPKEFVLYVGDVNYNKNIPNLIKASKIAKLPLVIVGKQAVEIDGLTKDIRAIKGPRDFLRFLLGRPHPELAHYDETLKAIKENGHVHRLGYVPDNELVVIYNLAAIYCQPSFYEGFGLPALEAVACGTPLAASKTQALVEILGDSATYFDPANPSQMAQAFKEVRRNGKLPRDYSWEKTARDTLNVYQSI